jgi:hypothetical protein
MFLQHLEQEVAIEFSWDMLEVTGFSIPSSNPVTGAIQMVLLEQVGMVQLAALSQMV